MIQLQPLQAVQQLGQLPQQESPQQPAGQHPSEAQQVPAQEVAFGKFECAGADKADSEINADNASFNMRFSFSGMCRRWGAMGRSSSAGDTNKDPIDKNEI